MIKLKNISVAYGKEKIYDNFSFEFEKGVNVIIGKSGLGKTTLLKVIAELLPYEGICEKDDKVSLVFQDPTLAPVSVYKNVDLVLGKKDDKSIILDLLKKAEIVEKKDTNVKFLSGGEKQRVSLARAFASQRKILLLDEPFSNLDYGVKLQLKKVLNVLLAEKDMTVIMVTHDIDEAIALADRIYLLKDRPATIEEVYEISQKRESRDEFDEKSLSLKKKLQELLK